MYEGFGAVIPAYNEVEHIAPVIEGVKGHLPAENIVVVDDGSNDETASVAGRLDIHVIRHEANRGKGAALKAGFEYLSSMEGIEAVFTIDADGQHDPGEIPRFVDTFRTGKCDFLIGSRMDSTAGMPAIRVFTNRLTSAVISWRTGQRIDDSQSGYRLIKCGLLSKLDLVSTRFDAESEILIKAGMKKASFASVPIRTIYAGERSKIRPFRDTFRFLILVIRSLFW